MASGLRDLIQNDYHTSDGRPMAETEWHCVLMNVRKSDRNIF
jgi:hypothetical protein